MSSLTARIRTTVAADSAAKLAAPLTASHHQHSPRALQRPYGGAPNRTVAIPSPVHIAALMGLAALECWVRRRLVP